MTVEMASMIVDLPEPEAPVSRSPSRLTSKAWYLWKVPQLYSSTRESRHCPTAGWALVGSPVTPAASAALAKPSLLVESIEKGRLLPIFRLVRPRRAIISPAAQLVLHVLVFLEDG